MSEPKVWCVKVAARYENGKLIEEFDESFASDMRHAMVPWADYQSLVDKLSSALDRADAAETLETALRNQIARAESRLDQLSNAVRVADAALRVMHGVGIGCVGQIYPDVGKLLTGVVEITGSRRRP